MKMENKLASYGLISECKSNYNQTMLIQLTVEMYGCFLRHSVYFKTDVEESERERGCPHQSVASVTDRQTDRSVCLSVCNVGVLWPNGWMLLNLVRLGPGGIGDSVPPRDSPPHTLFGHFALALSPISATAEFL